jgi:hypothetical protein
MNGAGWFNQIPLGGVFLVSVVVVLLSVTAGYYTGLWRRKRSPAEAEGPVGSVVGALLGLLAFLLAFTFGIAANRFDTRKQLLLDEVNAIGTASLRAELLPEPHRAECLKLLRRYVDIRVELTDHPEKIAEALAESEAIQKQLWAQAVALARADMNSDIGALFVESLNAVFDLQTSRTTVALQYRIPSGVWFGLLLVTIFSMAGVGYQFGLAGRRNPAVHLAMAITFSAVVLLIADLDRTTQGVLRVSQQPMLELQQKLNKPVR